MLQNPYNRSSSKDQQAELKRNRHRCLTHFHPQLDIENFNEFSGLIKQNDWLILLKKDKCRYKCAAHNKCLRPWVLRTI